MSDWRGKVVVVTGGSAGLGKALARTFIAAGAQVAIIGRDANRLADAAQALGTSAATFAGDVTQDEDVARVFQDIRARFGRLDALINNVGRSMRGFAADTSPALFRELMEVNLLAAVRCTQAALPDLRASRGHLVFIGSLASKVAASLLGAYPATKFAVAAYAHQLRRELRPDHVHVLLVCPGPIAREDAGTRYAEQLAALPEAARKPGGGARVKAIPPEQLAQRILVACEKRQAELVLPSYARLLFAIAQLSPTLGDWILDRKSS